MRLHHVAVIVGDLERAAGFYEGVLGLVREARPDLGFPGIFYSLGEGQQLHLMQVANPYEDCVRPDHGGRDCHLALTTDALSALVSRLNREGVAHTRSKSGRNAIFFRDPDGNAIEVVQICKS